jgi:hypothetical protein
MFVLEVEVTDYMFFVPLLFAEIFDILQQSALCIQGEGVILHWIGSS